MNQAALMQAILEAPEDDEPRLVYSDWLEEHGEAERAEFIRLQVQLARLPEDDPGLPELKRRETALLQAHREQWLQAAPGALRHRVKFRRGFLGQLDCTAPE